MKAQEHLNNLLGMTVRDRITNMRGVVTSISFDLYGCIQAIVNRGLDKDGKPYDQVWFDLNRLEVDESCDRAIPLPDFASGPISEGRKGPESKPSPGKP